MPAIAVRASNILKRKPNLKMCTNHIKYILLRGRVWDSARLGPARSDGVGWYVRSGILNNESA